jgi:hypothetical protein
MLLATGEQIEPFGPRDLWALPVLLPVGASVLFFSTLLDRGFAAVGAALVAAAAIVWLALTMKDAGPGFAPARGTLLPAALILSGAFLFGSFVAFTWGRVHLDGKPRRAGLAFIGLVLFLAPPLVHAGIEVTAWQKLDFDDPEARYFVGRPSPDGRWLPVVATRPGTDPRGWGPGPGPWGAKSPVARWVVDLEGGPPRDVTAAGELWSWHVATWAEGPGTVVLWRREPVPGEKRKELWVRTVYDLEAGRVRKARAAQPEKGPVVTREPGPPLPTPDEMPGLPGLPRSQTGEWILVTPPDHSELWAVARDGTRRCLLPRSEDE